MGITGCCNKSGNENITSTPRVFSSYRIFARVIKKRRGWASPCPLGGRHPRPARDPPPWCRDQRTSCDLAIGANSETAKRANRECRSEKCRSHRNRWQRRWGLGQGAHQRDRRSHSLRKGSAGPSSEDLGLIANSDRRNGRAELYAGVQG